MNLKVDRLTTDDLNAAYRLSTQIGWNQTKADWHRLLSLFPDTCFAGRLHGELVATSTLATYGSEIGWIGMVLVDEAYRRKGYGSTLFERALDAALDLDLEIVGLDATDAGCAVYRQYGFQKTGEIYRWGSTVQMSDSDTEDDTVSTEPEVSEILSFDRHHSGVDRSALLQNLLQSSHVTGLVRRQDKDIRGYAIIRPGRTYPQVGPVVAPDHDDVGALLSAIGRRIGDTIIDAPYDSTIRSTLEQHGFEVQRELRRMTYPEHRQVLNGAAIAAATGFEWG